MRSPYREVPFCQTGRGDTWLSIQSQPSGPRRVGALEHVQSKRKTLQEGLAQAGG